MKNENKNLKAKIEEITSLNKSLDLAVQQSRLESPSFKPGVIECHSGKKARSTNIVSFKNFDLPHGVCIAKDGKIILANNGRHQVLKVPPLHGAAVNPANFEEFGTPGTFSYPFYVAVDPKKENIIVVDGSPNMSIRLFKMNGELSWKNDKFSIISCILIDNNEVIVAHDNVLTFLSIITGDKLMSVTLKTELKIKCFSVTDTHYFVSMKEEIYKIDKKSLKSNSSPKPFLTNINACHFVMDAEGKFIVANSTTGSIEIYNKKAQKIMEIPMPNKPKDFLVAVDGDGNIIASVPSQNSLVKCTFLYLNKD